MVLNESQRGLEIPPDIYLYCTHPGALSFSSYLHGILCSIALVWNMFSFRVELMMETVYRATDTSPLFPSAKKSSEVDSRQDGFPNFLFRCGNREGLFLLAYNTKCLLPSDKTDTKRHFLGEDELSLIHT